MDLRVPVRARYQIDAPGRLVSRHRADDGLRLVYDDSTIVTIALDSDGLACVSVSDDRILGLDGTTGAIVVSHRPTPSRRRRETADATAI